MKRRGDSGVSEIVGTILLTALAVVFASGFVILLFTAPPPTSDAQPTIQAYVLPTAGNQLVLEHRGGPSIPLSQLSAIVTVNGSATTYVIGGDPSWTVVSAEGVAKGATGRFAAGDRAVFTSSALYGARATALLTDTGANTLVLSPAELRGAPSPANITSVQTVTNDTIRVDFDKTLLSIAPGDFRINGVAPIAARIIGEGDSAELVAAAPFATSATPTITTLGTISGTTDTSGLAFGTYASRVANDTLAPEITGGPSLVGSPDTTLANLTWTPTEASSTVVEFGPTPALGRSSTDNALVTTHTVQLTTLTPGTLYYYSARSTDAAGNKNSTDIASFTTAAISGTGGAAFDTAAPHSWTAVQTYGAGDLKVSDIIKGANAYQLPTNADTLAGLGNVQTYSALQTFGAGATIAGGQGLFLTPTATGSLPSDAAGFLVYDATLGKLRVGSGAGYGSLLTSGNVTNVDLANGASIAYSKLNLSDLVTTANITDGTILNIDINPAARIAYSKLNLANSIVNADVASGAAIAYSKLALANSLVAGDLTTGSVTSAKILDGEIVDADISATAGIVDTKLATISTAGKVSATALPTAAAGVAGIIPSTGATSAMITDGTITNADINAAAAIADTKLATISTAGKVSDSALSSNVALLTGSQTFSGAKTFGAGATISGGQGLTLTPTATGSLPAAVQGLLVYDSTTNGIKIGTGPGTYVSPAFLGTAQTWTALQTFGTNAAFDASDITTGTLAVARGGTGLASYTAGDLIYANGATSLTKLGIGATGTVLHGGGSAPSYSQIVNADVAAGAAIAWSKIDKTGSSLADLATRSAGDLNSGTLLDARLSSNVALLNAANTWTAVQTFGASPKVSAGFGFILAPTATGSLPTCTAGNEGMIMYDATLHALKVCGQGSTTFGLTTTDANKYMGHVWPASGTTETLTVNQPDTNYGFFCSPEYSASQNIFIVSKSTTSVTVNYGTGGRGQTADCIIFR